MLVQSNVPKFIYQAVINKINTIHVQYSNNNIVSTINGKTIYISISQALQEIRNKKNQSLNKKLLIAVHQAGHALVHVILYNKCPKQITINTTKQNQGFIMPYTVFQNRELMLKSVTVLLAGRAAQEIIFGKQLVCAGSSSDIYKASNIITSMHNSIGMYNNIQTVYNQFTNQKSIGVGNVKLNNDSISAEIKKCFTNANNIINNNIKLFIQLTQYLYINNKIESQEFQNICNKYFKDDINTSDDIVINDYNIIWNTFKNKIQEIQWQKTHSVNSGKHFNLR